MRPVVSPGFAGPEACLGEEPCRAACGGGNLDACFELGMLLQTFARTAEAVPVLQRVCDAGRADGCGELGAVLRDRADFAGAERLLRDACDLLLDFLMEAERWAEAEPLAREDCERDAFTTCEDLGRILERLDRGEDAAAVYGTACEKSGWSNLCAAWIRALRRLGRTDEALESARQACREGRDSPDCTTLRHLLGDLGREDELEPLLRERCEVDRRRACSALADFFAGRGRPAEAIEAFRACCAAGDAYCCNSLAVRVSGDDAAEARRRACALDASYCDR